MLRYAVKSTYFCLVSHFGKAGPSPIAHSLIQLSAL